CSSGDLNHAAETLDDLESAISFAVDSFECPRCVVVGHSMGALAGLLVGSKMESVAGVAAIATGPRPSAGFRQPLGIAMLSQRSDYVSGAAAMQILEEFDSLAESLAWPESKPALFVAAKGDVVVKPSRVKELADRCGPNGE